jgi:hypothetical protein
MPAVIGVERDGSVVITGRTDSTAFLGSAATGIVAFAANLFPAITVENSASYAANRVAAGENVAIQGYGIGPAAGAVSSPASSLGGVQVHFDSFAAPLIYPDTAARQGIGQAHSDSPAFRLLIAVRKGNINRLSYNIRKYS